MSTLLSKIFPDIKVKKMLIWISNLTISTRLIFLLVLLNPGYKYAIYNANNFISGIIKDANTGEVIPNANVYLSNTTIGTSSDIKGEFNIPDIPDGTYNLIIRVLGYEMKVLNINISGNQKKRIEIDLKPKTIELNEVIVSAPSPEEWKRLFKIFEKEFIGETANAKECKILNPEIINFNYDNTTQILTASSDSILVVENKALGYKLHIVLLSFELKTEPYLIRYKIHPRFEESQPLNQSERENIKSNRQNTYLGSLRDFLTKIKDKTYEKELFKLTYGSIYDLYRNKGQHLSKDLLTVKIEVDDSSLISISGPEYIGVEYLGSSDNSFSIIRMNSTTILMDKNCNLIDPFSITCYGNWTRQRIADMLPDNYRMN